MPHQITAARDAILSYIAETKNTSVVNGKMIFLQGSPELYKIGNILTGRLSGIVAHHIPIYLNLLPLRFWHVKDMRKRFKDMLEERIVRCL